MRCRAFAAVVGPLMGLILLGATAVVRVSAADPMPPAPPAIPLTVAVDPRVELISIIYRLAGNPEYSRCLVPGYAKDLDAQFASVREHPVVLLARKLRSSRGVSYDAPMSLAVHLKDADNLELRVPLQPWPDGVDQRWRAEDIHEFLAQARDFAAASKFKEFLQAQAALYQQTGEALQTLALETGHLEWFNTFFGERPSARFHLVPALVNGGELLWSAFPLRDQRGVLLRTRRLGGGLARQAGVPAIGVRHRGARVLPFLREPAHLRPQRGVAAGGREALRESAGPDAPPGLRQLGNHAA